MIGLVLAAALAMQPYIVTRGGPLRGNADFDFQPPRTRQGPLRADVQFVSRAEVRRLCRSEHAASCHWTDERGDHLIVLNPCSFYLDTYGLLLCHELGHAHGWPADHRGGHFVPEDVMHRLPTYPQSK